ncbi:hypothetical protein M1212_35685 [Streptomyces sp. 43Y-GA-1]|nr:hypothetical protein [Streptomyces sp. 43Y-GA-1]
MRPYSGPDGTGFFAPSLEKPSLPLFAVFATASRCSRLARPEAMLE